MYQTNEENDGYSALKLYLETLNPACDALFQYPKRKPADQTWYENRPLGVNKLGNMMKDISAAAGLSTIYTNHCVRATSITLWSNAGLTNRHIMSISGHRNEQSLQHYSHRPSTSQLKRCSQVLSEPLGNKTVQSDGYVAVQRKRTTESLQANSNNSISSHVATASFTSQSSTVQMQNQPNFGSLFSGCSIGNVNVNFNQQH